MGEALDLDPTGLNSSPPTRWGKGYKGPRREAFPLPDEYSLDDSETPLDETSVSILTRTFSDKIKHKPHACVKAWNQRLGITQKQWIIIATRYNNTFLTPRDYHLHFKHITHRRIGTKIRFANDSQECRFCHRYKVTSVHLGRCPGIRAIFRELNLIAGFKPAKNRNSQQKALDILFCFPHFDTPQCISHLYMIAWRFILTDFYQINYNPEFPLFTEKQALSIYARTLERYTTLALAKAYHVRALLIRRSHTSDPPPLRLIKRTNKALSPLFHLSEEDARITKSENLSLSLTRAKKEHVGKNIPLQEANYLNVHHPKSIPVGPRP
jgi:hypothetical protein